MSNQNGSPKPIRRVTGKALFDCGLIAVTPGAQEVMRKHGLHPLILIARHLSGDWGEIHADDKGLNEQALKDGSRILSVYKFGKDAEDVLWVITEASRMATTVLTPDEY